MKYPKYISIFAGLVGVMMISMWIFFIITGQVPEFEAKKAEISLHLTAEFTTALLLVTASALTLMQKDSGVRLMPFSLGMLLYTLIVSPGYYVASKEYAFAVMFFVLVMMTVIAYVKHFSWHRNHNGFS